MKAKDLASKFIIIVDDIKNEQQILDAVSMLVKEFQQDFLDLRKIRNPKTDRALIPMFVELDNKWNAVRRRLIKHYKVAPIKIDGFSQILKNTFPEGYKYYKSSIL